MPQPALCSQLCRGVREINPPMRVHGVPQQAKVSLLNPAPLWRSPGQQHSSPYPVTGFGRSSKPIERQAAQPSPQSELQRALLLYKVMKASQ
jgi:hypothetical protein